jgi:hypothetical protein
MARYTKKSHGLVVGWGDNFFFIDPFDKITDFPALLSFNNYRPERITTRTIKVKTPAIQLCWDVVSIPVPTTSLFTRYQKNAIPQPWFKDWLDDNCPGWFVTPPTTEEFSIDYSLFFASKKDALKTVSLVEEILSGIPLKLA